MPYAPYTKNKKKSEDKKNKQKSKGKRLINDDIFVFCPICQCRVKKDNLKKHKEKTHPRGTLVKLTLNSQNNPPSNDCSEPGWVICAICSHQVRDYKLLSHLRHHIHAAGSSKQRNSRNICSKKKFVFGEDRKMVSPEEIKNILHRQPLPKYKYTRPCPEPILQYDEEQYKAFHDSLDKPKNMYGIFTSYIRNPKEYHFWHGDD